VNFVKLFIAFLLGSASPALGRESTKQRDKELECMHEFALSEKLSDFDFEMCEIESVTLETILAPGRAHAKKMKLREVFISRFYSKYGFEKTMGLLARYDTGVEKKRQGRFFFSQYSNYAHNLYWQHPEITTEMYVNALKKHGVFNADRLQPSQIIALKTQIGEGLTGQNLTDFLTDSDVPTTITGYYFANFYSAFSTQKYRKVITDFARDYMDNRASTKYRFLIQNPDNLIRFLNFLALYAEDEIFHKIGKFLSKRLNSLAYEDKLELIYVFYRMDRDIDLYHEADGSQCYLMLRHNEIRAYNKIKSYCSKYLTRLSYFHSVLAGLQQKGTTKPIGQFSKNSDYQEHDLYLRHYMEKEGLGKVLAGIQSLTLIKQSHILVQASKFLASNADWRALEGALGKLNSMNVILQDKTLQEQILYLDKIYENSQDFVLRNSKQNTAYN